MEPQAQGEASLIVEQLSRPMALSKPGTGKREAGLPNMPVPLKPPPKQTEAKMKRSHRGHFSRCLTKQRVLESAWASTAQELRMNGCESF